MSNNEKTGFSKKIGIGLAIALAIFVTLKKRHNSAHVERPPLSSQNVKQETVNERPQPTTPPQNPAVSKNFAALPAPIPPPTPMAMPEIPPEQKNLITMIEATAKKIGGGLNRESDAEGILKELNACVSSQQNSTPADKALKAACITMGQKVVEKFPSFQDRFEKEILSQAPPDAVQLAKEIMKNLPQGK